MYVSSFMYTILILLSSDISYYVAMYFVNIKLKNFVQFGEPFGKAVWKSLEVADAIEGSGIPWEICW